MTKQIIIFIIITFITKQTLGQSNQIYFAKNSDIISTEFKPRLDSLITELKKGNGTEEIGLVGHTDSDASNEYNKNLSFRRSKTVKEYLISNGIKNQIHIDSKGESQQLNQNKTEFDKAKNRRVEILRNYSKNNFVFNDFDKEFQVFTINTLKDTILKCKFGTNIQIDKNIFQSTNPSDPITIKVQEFYDKKDFVLSNLTTQDLNNNQLVSSGMINIEAFQNDKKLEVKSDKKIGVLFKDRKPNDDSETFNGITHDEEIAWDNTTNSSQAEAVEVSGSSITRSGNYILESSIWKYEIINGEKYKIIETLKNGITSHDTISAESENLTKDLVLNSKKLGWINCDRFYKDNSTKIDLIVEYKGDFVPNLVVVFEDINSVLPYSYREDNKLIFKNIPSDKNIVFIGLFKSKNSDKILFAQKKTISKNSLVEDLQFEELSKDEVAQKINAL
jgi:hypothetical protein